ncbi:SIMPL domain-containing protein [Anaerosporobacter faecicola]|uniref:SIMPL domain-containing protein n=1 Tax=Anaerosporobacter faecicola TaxID=2718714 RepID=UPI00143C418F|nr:SIMPL domain-containing protein [Anaerosporobacter faecicola]
MNENKHKVLGNIIVALVLAAGVIISAVIGVNGIVKIKTDRTNIIVTGSAKQQIVSDLIVWTGYFHSQNKVLTDAYTDLEKSREKVSKYLTSLGITEDEVVFSSISTNTYFYNDEYGNSTNEVDYYDLSQTVTITSSDIDKVTDISRSATELLNDGVQFQSYDPQYLYTKLADIKVTMLAEATKDARKRAEMIAENAGSKLGDLTYADMGVMQITPLYSNEISDYGMSDTTSLEKEITAVVHCTFTIKK